MTTYYVPAGGGHIHYYRFGQGPQPVLCFHGYGEDGTVFRFLEEAAGHTHSFYCMDLPFHGKTTWPANTAFTVADLQQVAGQMTGNREAYALMGFSLGGRMALGLYEAAPAAVSKLLLLAPDGLKVNFWYWLSTQTVWGNRIFRFTMRQPGWFLGLLNLFNKVKLVNPSVFKFVRYYIGDAEIRKLLYLRWTSLRKVRPHLGQIRRFINTYRTSTKLIYGRHDRIILSSVGKKFMKGAEKHVELRMIDSGHQVLHPKHAGAILAALNDN